MDAVSGNELKPSTSYVGKHRADKTPLKLLLNSIYPRNPQQLTDAGGPVGNQDAEKRGLGLALEGKVADDR